MRESLRRFDERERAAVHKLTLPTGSPWRWLAALGAHLGDGPLWVIVGGGLLIWGNPFLRGLTWIAALAVLGSTGASTAIKYLVRRRRPQELTQFYASKHDRYSFPSGHATRMAAIAVIVGHLVPDLALTGYALALTVAVCRVLVGVHYPSDVLAGMLIGCTGAGLVTQLF